MLEFYLQNEKNRSLPRRHFQLAKITLKRWINQYNYNVINVLVKKNYSPEFKLAIVQAVMPIKNKTSVFTEAFAKN